MIDFHMNDLDLSGVDDLYDLYDLCNLYYDLLLDGIRVDGKL